MNVNDRRLLLIREVLAHNGSIRLKADGWHLAMAGGDGLGAWDHSRRGLRIIHSAAIEEDGNVWSHVSVSRRIDGLMPTWRQARDAFWLICPNLYGIIVVAPENEHVNISEVAHVWGNHTEATVPDFTRGTASI